MIEPWIDTSDRSEVVRAVRAEYGKSVPSMDWTGSYDGCEPGGSSTALRLATMRRLNFYRALAGVRADVVVDPHLSAKAQHAALMMSAEGDLSHHPDEEYACFSEIGRQAAANSNLYLGRTGPTAIDGYIEDPGERNRDVGHRLTILHPPTERMGVGHVAGSPGSYPANALWVFDDQVFADEVATREAHGLVAWPPRGFLPAELVYPRWSVSIDEADFSNASVTMTMNGDEVPLRVVTNLSRRGEVPSSVLVWEPAGDLADLGALTPSKDGDASLDALFAAGDLEVEVTVDNILLSSGQSYTAIYTVAILPPGLDDGSLGQWISSAAARIVGAAAGGARSPAAFLLAD